MLITGLWSRQSGRFFCISTKSASRKWEEHFFERKDFKQALAFIHDNRDKDIYFCPHGFSEKRRLKKHAVIPNMLWADLDEVDPRECKPKPSIAIESSPGRYVGLWLTDKPITEELNRRLTYHLGADAGGWDLTQVLRVPSTINHKYAAKPRVRLLWDDGPSYQLAKLEKMLPDVEEDEAADDAQDIIDKYEKQLPSWARRELLDDKPIPRGSDRSKVFWKLAQTLINAGMSRDEVFNVLKTSRWNKFTGRDKTIRDQLKKIVRERLSKGDADKVNGYQFFAKPISEVEEENINWIWYPYLARGEVTIIEGDPGLGKSYFAQMVSKAICDGDKLPSQEAYSRTRGTVLFADLENSAARVTKRRLKWNKCQHMEQFYQEEQPFSVRDENAMDHIYDAIERIRPAMFVVDPINQYLGDTDTGKATETTQALAQFKDIAERFNCAVIIVRHLNKGTGKALYRGQGNIAFAGVARIVLTLGQDPEDDEIRVLSVTKNNLAPHPKALTFSIVASPGTMKDRHPSRFEWGDFVDLTSDQILGVPKKSNATQDAVQFLKDVLSDGAIEVPKIETMAEKHSISRRTLYRAADQLNVKRILPDGKRNQTRSWQL